MAVVKVFLPTYNRNSTLKRSIASLLAQTFTDWECEVHNDSPGNEFPQEYVKGLKDNRFKFITHDTNLGAVATFNLMFDKTGCKYICLLEDDNWWEPEFLLIMTAQMDRYPECSIGYAGYNIWKESLNDNWEKVTPNETLSPAVSIVNFSEEINFLGYHHASCSIIVRNSDRLDGYKVPSNIRFDFIEHFRERAFHFPLLFVDAKLTNFAVTLSSNRESVKTGWYEHQLLLIDSFFKNFTANDKQIDYLWKNARHYTFKAYFHLIYAGILYKSSRPLLKNATASAWFYFILYNVKHPTLLYKNILAKKSYKQLWDFLLIKTEQRAKEASLLNTSI